MQGQFGQAPCSKSFVDERNAQELEFTVTYESGCSVRRKREVR